MASESVTWYNVREFSEAARSVLAEAERIAVRASSDKHGNVPVGARHVACAIFCEHPVGPHIAESAQIDLEALRAALLEIAFARGLADDNTALFLRYTRAQRPSFGPKGVEDLVLGIFESPFNLAPTLAQHGLTLEALRKALPDMRGNAAPVWGHALEASVPTPVNPPPTPTLATHPTSPRSSSQQGPPRNPGIAASRQARKENKSDQNHLSLLATFGVDLVQEARKGCLDPVIGRDAEVARVLQILARRTKNNVCLVGAPGVGKTAIAEAVAQHIATSTLPPQLSKCQELWSLDIGAMLAGTGLRGDFEERLRDILSALKSTRGAALVFIDELHLVLGAGRSESNNVDAANLMKPMLARGEIRCIGATTTEEYRSLILAKDAAFERRFQVISLLEPSPPVAVNMLRGLCPLYQNHHAVAIAPSALDTAVYLTHAKITGRSLPDKAIDALDEACCLAVAEGSGEVLQAHVVNVVERWCLQSPRLKAGIMRQLLDKFNLRRLLSSRL